MRYCNANNVTVQGSTKKMIDYGYVIITLINMFHREVF